MLAPDGRAAVEATADTMNILLWILQILAALIYGASGVMKIFMFDKISADQPSFGALPRNVWMILGIIELICVVGLIVPSVLHWHPKLTVVAATVLALGTFIVVMVRRERRTRGTLHPAKGLASAPAPALSIEHPAPGAPRRGDL